MKAFYITSYKGPEAARCGTLPDPVAKKNQILIGVKAASINPVDYKVKKGDAKIISGFSFPKIVGSDFAGIVKEASPGNNKFKPGDRVYGSVSFIFRHPGSFCELLATDIEKVRLIPPGMSFEEAASLPIASLTALNGLRRCGVTAGSEVLINGATGGVGHFAVQIAKARGAYISATCSSANNELAKKLGADEITGYSKTDLAGITRRFDAILDAHGRMDYSDVCRLLKRGGTYASTLSLVSPTFSSISGRIVYGIRLTSANMRSRPGDYEEIEKLYTEKKLKPLIENIFTLDKAADAFEMAENGKPRGKIVVMI